MITKKYNYEKIDRTNDNGIRKYCTPDGKKLVSVTTILSETKDKTHLIEWRKRVGEKKATEITTEAANRGTRMHKYLETYIETGVWPTPGSNPYAQHAHKMATVIKINAMDDVDEIWGSEVALYMPNIYAGTADVIGSYKGNASILDFKQTNKIKKQEWIEDYFLQVCLYAEAHNELFDTDIKEAHIFMCSQNLEYQQFDIWPDEYAYWKNKAWDRVEQYYSTYG